MSNNGKLRQEIHTLQASIEAWKAELRTRTTERDAARDRAERMEAVLMRLEGRVVFGLLSKWLECSMCGNTLDQETKYGHSASCPLDAVLREGDLDAPKVEAFCDCYDDGVMSVLGPVCLRHRARRVLG
jgi:hypothetical protein